MMIPNAKSEPRDVDDAAISHLLTLAREYSTQSGSEFAHLARNLADLCETDPKLKTLGEQAQLLMGNGALLQGIFRRLFPAQTYPFAMAHLDSKPNLTDREHQVLLELARGRSREQLARRLSIKPGTVKRHIENIYRKLGVESSAEAIAKSTALGLADFDLVDIVLPFVDGKNLDLTHFANMMLVDRLYGNEPSPDVLVCKLASTSLIIMLLAASLFHDETRHGIPERYEGFRGAIYEFTIDGTLISRIELEWALRIPFAISLAPVAAARHGFTPGHLYVLNGCTFPDAVNHDYIFETTPRGDVRRTFTGGRSLATRLNACDIAFTSQGSLLAASGNRTDAILEFTEGGEMVRRFIDIIPYGGLATHDSGRIYIAGGRWYQNPVHVYGSDGSHLKTVGLSEWSPGEEAVYQGIAVDYFGRLFVANSKTGQIEAYDNQGARIDKFKSELANRPWRLAVDRRGNLFSIAGSWVKLHHDRARCASQIDVFDAKSGATRGRITAPPGSRFISLCVGPNDTLFVGAICL